MRKLYEFKRKESMLVETVKAEPASQRSVQVHLNNSLDKVQENHVLFYKVTAFPLHLLWTVAVHMK